MYICTIHVFVLCVKECGRTIVWSSHAEKETIIINMHLYFNKNKECNEHKRKRALCVVYSIFLLITDTYSNIKKKICFYSLSLNNKFKWIRRRKEYYSFNLFLEICATNLFNVHHYVPFLLSKFQIKLE